MTARVLACLFAALALVQTVRASGARAPSPAPRAVHSARTATPAPSASAAELSGPELEAIAAAHKKECSTEIWSLDVHKRALRAVCRDLYEAGGGSIVCDRFR